MATWRTRRPAGSISRIRLDVFRAGTPAQQTRFTNMSPPGRNTPWL
jgi:hypothetical protein